MDMSAKNVGEYIATLPADAQKLVLKMRKTIKEAAPGAEESMGYGVPSFKLNGKQLVYYAAFRDHLGFYPGSSRAIRAFSKELIGYETAKGTVRFPFGKPVPWNLIKKIVAFRINEI